MKRIPSFALVLTVALCSSPLRAQINKPIYISLPGPGNIQHLAYVVAKEKKFYDEMGLTNVNIVVLRGNAMNVQALLSGSVHYSSAFGPSMQAMFKGEQIRVLLQIFNQIPFGLITRPEIKRLEDLKGQKIAVTFGGSTYSVLQALFVKHGHSEKFAEYLNIPDNEGKAIALMQGRASAALMAPPTDRPLLKAGMKRLVYLGDEFKNVPFSALQAMAKHVQDGTRHDGTNGESGDESALLDSRQPRGQYRYHHEERPIGSAGDRGFALRFDARCLYSRRSAPRDSTNAPNWNLPY